MEIPGRQHRYMLRAKAECRCIVCSKLAYRSRSMTRCLKHLRKARAAARRYRRYSPVLKLSQSFAFIRSPSP
jgi:uncharacterized metal-binding protein